jgi:glycerol-3-phosphate cytidylyltransferase-like family protein
LSNLDTRKKILSLDEFVAGDTGQPWTAVVGVFDPLTVEVVRYITRLAGAGRKLLVVVGDPVDDRDGGQGSATFLNAEARARMLASLRVVDAVVIASAATVRDAFRSANIDVHFEEDTDADRQRSERFVQYVMDRQASAVAEET